MTLWSVNSARLLGTRLNHTPYAGLVSKEEERSTVYFSPPSHPDDVWAAAIVFADLVPKSLTIQYACSLKRPFVELDGSRFAAAIPDWCSRAFKTYFKEMSITAAY